ncbi:hypothetical protein [Serratia fonticola]|uniref:hypothetical protein n=1 Tax=Serratia fonticola TaxID=47917 RepID=UPI0027FFD94F|nr:hypothetical protein [Serratia fonticola]MDQ7208503.1 hypothetical protein [Serratia fonticola]HBE9082966.1 hypothetical protein [Serratia fonticola]HBE9093481.1 hypothetical protein [Serratia fonticola]HBE9151676.1 hypothetical protein [Serratia fonticola]
MKTKPVQLAHLYRGGLFLGYGLTVDGALLEQQVETTIASTPGEIACIAATFRLTNEMVGSPVRIDLDNQDKSTK